MLQVGDLVKFLRPNDPAVGIVVRIEEDKVWVSWSFLAGNIGRQYISELKVINESR